MDEATVQAELLKAFSHQPQQQTAPLQELTHLTQQEQVVCLGTGQAPVPGEQGFAGRVQDGQGQQAGVEPTQDIGQQPKLLNNFNDYLTCRYRHSIKLWNRAMICSLFTGHKEQWLLKDKVT